MTKQQLEQYSDTKREIIRLENKLKALTNNPLSVISDCVNGSSTEFPYLTQHITVHGTDAEQLKRARSIRRLLKKRLNTLFAEVYAIEDFISSIPDSRARQIIDYKYLQGKSWKQTASHVYGWPCEDRARKHLEKFLSR